jgi:hypothetical protein
MISKSLDFGVLIILKYIIYLKNIITHKKDIDFDIVHQIMCISVFCLFHGTCFTKKTTKTRFCSFLPQVVCSRVHVLFVCGRIVVSITCCVVFLRLVLPISLDCPFLIAPYVFTNRTSFLLFFFCCCCCGNRGGHHNTELRT